MTTWIRSIGTALPEYSIAQSDAALLAQKLRITERWHDALPALYRKSGVQRRGSVLLLNGDEADEQRQLFYPHSDVSPRGPTTSVRMKAYAQHAGPLLEQASINAIDASQLSRSSLTHLVTVSCTGFVSPGIDHWLIDRLGLETTVQRTHVGFMGCHGIINGIRVANAIASSDPSATVLVAAVELCSLHQQYSEDPQQLVANALFADGAASVVVSALTEEVARSPERWRVVSSSSWKIPNTTTHMAWTVGDYGFEMKLSPEVPAIIEAHLKGPFEQWLATHGLNSKEIGMWAIHPGGPRILDSVERTFELSQSQVQPSRDVLGDYGNMSSPTVLFILKRMLAIDADSRNCVLLAFGPGLHAEAILLSRE